MTLLAGCNDSGSSSGSSDTDIEILPPPSVETINWDFGGNASMVSAAQVAGKYAVANSQSAIIEVRNINQKLKDSLHMSDIQSLVPDMSVYGDNGLCGMTLTPSGRFLYLAVCGAGTDDNKDAILAYNTNTKELKVFDRVTLSHSDSGNFGMTYFQGQLYVGSENGVYIYDANRNAVFESNGEADGKLVSTSGAVTGLAVDMVDQKIYLATSNELLRMNPDGSGRSAIATGRNFTALTMGRVYGNKGDGGLFILQNDGESASILTVHLEDLRKNASVPLKRYHQLDPELADIAATADGRMLLAEPSPQVMYDTTDTRLSYEEWLENELDQYLAAIKSLVEHGGIDGTSNLIGKPGMLMRKIEKAGNNPNRTPIADNVGWALFLLMAIDEVKNDPDIEEIVELLIQTHAGLNPGHGGERTVDGHFVRVYASDGEPDKDKPQPQVYVSMKFLPAAFKAAEMYPHNQNLQEYREYLRQVFKRSSDTIAAEQRITWTNDDHGPLPTGGKGSNRMSNETWIYGDIGAAQDPLATANYATYTYDRDSFNVDNWLKGEPVILSSHAAFIVMGATLILNHHYYGEDWQEQNRNYYGVTMAETDDMGAPYFAAFSAGNHPRFQPPGGGWTSYYNDGPSDHPNDILHFPAVLGFGQHSLTSPMVGGYMAYRDNRRQAMNNASGGDNIPMLTRWSMEHDDYVMDSVGIADFWYGGVGLVETIKPGTIDRFRDDFYRPYVKVEENGKLLYSNMTPRRVIGIDDDVETPYGFQMSPFNLPQHHERYEVIDPEGDWIELEDLVNELDHGSQAMHFTNPYFINDLTGWETPAGSAHTVSGVAGRAVQVNNGFISQPLDVSLALDNTRYVVRALGKTLNGDGYLRVSWRATDNVNDTVLGEDISEKASTDITELVLKTSKPENANYLFIEFVADGQAQFENTAAMMRGADFQIENGDFENDDMHWNLTSPARIDNRPDIATAGDHVLRMMRGPAVISGLEVTREFDVSKDPVGTRYLFRFDANAADATDIEFKAHIDVEDANGNRVVNREDLAFIDAGFVGERTFTIRRRPTDATFKLTFEMKRSSKDSVGQAEIFIDNFRLDKERLFDARDCVDNSPTGCLPGRH